MNKAVVLIGFFLAGLVGATVAAINGDVVGIAGGSAVMGGCLGYLLGRIDLRHELGISQS